MEDWPETVAWLFSGQEIPLLVKALYTLFVAILVPVYWHYYGPANFLWFSDLALLITMVALWLENPLLASMQAVSVVLLELAWIVDFASRLIFGTQVLGIAEYMFEKDKPLFLRALSLFHLVIPFLLLWLVYRLGYDGRAWLVQTVFAWAIRLICFFFTPPSDNINWVFGLGKQPQRWVRPKVFLLLLIVFLSLCVYLPTHLALGAFMPR
jgi:hypothetical protein